jgi:hypothetical protein
MKILAIEHEAPHAEPGHFTRELLRAEAQRLWELQQEDVVREAYFRADRSEAVLVLECASEDAARALLETLPLVQAGLIAFELIPLRPYPGLARLFVPGGGAD